MRFFISFIAMLALAAPAGLLAQNSNNAPACRASLDGDLLTTAISFPDGYAVEGPWRVYGNRAVSLEDGRPGMAMSASLDRIVEVDPATGQRITTPFSEPIQTTFEGQSEEDLVYRAAQIWCLTVLKAQENSHSPSRRDSSGPGAPPAARTGAAT